MAGANDVPNTRDLIAFSREKRAQIPDDLEKFGHFLGLRRLKGEGW
jgi:hypothetical protein